MVMDKETRLKMAIALSFCFMLVEIAGGIYANSLSILADAAHLFTDVTGFVIALIAVILATHPPTSSFTYGLARAEVMGAFCSVLTLWLVTIYLVYTAYIRILMWIEGKAEPVDGKLMFIIAAFGICVNVCLGLVFHDDASSLSAHAHDHSHEHGHGHEHDHGHDHGHRFDHNVAELDHDRKHGHKHDHKHGHDRGHDHGHESHDHGHGHGHSHDHAHADEKTSLIATSHNNAHTYGGAELDSACIESDHQHDHAHGEHHQESCSSGDHAPVLVYAAPHSGGGDLNLQAAYMHVIADLIQSAGVALAGALIWYNPEWQIIDPICTFLFSILVVWATFALMYRIVSIFMEGTPAHLDYYAVLRDLQAIPGVTDVHDLHIWSISSEAVSLTCHMRAENPEAGLRDAHKVCSKYHIQHPTIQVQSLSDKEECHAPACSIPGGCV